MKAKIRSEQESPLNLFAGELKDFDSLNSHMFIEDMCLDFSIEFTPNNGYHDFFFIEAPDNKLTDLLEDTHNFLVYNLSHLLSDIVYNILVKKKAYVQVIKKFDDDVLTGISFRILDVEGVKKINGVFFFSGHTFDKKKVKFSIHQDDIIEFVLKDVYKSTPIKSIVRRLSEIEITGSSNLIIDKKISYNFMEHNRVREFEFLKYTRQIFWLGRNVNNYYLNDFTILHRIADFKKFKLRLLEYLIAKINQSILLLGNKYNFEGAINYKAYTIQEIDNKIRELDNGLCSFKEASDFLHMRG